MPKRYQLKTRQSWQMPEGAIVVSRPSKWANPVKIEGARDRATVIKMFREWLLGDDPRAVKMRSELEELRGKDLVCTCKFPGPCHGDVLIELANR